MSTDDDEVLEVDGVVATDGAVTTVRAAGTAQLNRRPALPVVAQVAAVAATGFAAGALSAVLVRAARTRRPLPPGGPAEMLGLPRPVATRTFLVQVHTITPRD